MLSETHFEMFSKRLYNHVDAITISRQCFLRFISFIAIPISIMIFFRLYSRPRQAVLPPYHERVLILGASSGVGRELALAYARRGCCSLAIVGRRERKLEEVAMLCEQEHRKNGEWEESEGISAYCPNEGKKGILSVPANCAHPEDILRVRDKCKDAFQGIDTIHICFGVSALRPLLGISGIDPIRRMKRADLLPDPPKHEGNGSEADLYGLMITQEATRRINDINITATSLILTAFVPLLQMMSPSPSIHLLSSAAAVIPAPTRSLYGASKAAQLVLFQAAAIEAAAQAKHTSNGGELRQRAHIRFYASLPGTIQSDFRASAIDGYPSEEFAFDSSWNIKDGERSDALLPSTLAKRVIRAIDRYKEGVEEMPFKYWAARRAFPFVPGLLARIASKKYSYG